MKEVKAYIRLERAEDVIHALEEAGVGGFTVLEVKAVGRQRPREGESFSVEYAEKVSPMAKIEAVCNDRDEKSVVEAIRDNALTGRSGDGVIYVSDVARAVKIRTGESGPGALAPGPKGGG